MSKSKLVVSKETFLEIILGLIKSGVIFEAEEVDEVIVIKFTGGY